MYVCVPKNVKYDLFHKAAHLGGLLFVSRIFTFIVTVEVSLGAPESIALIIIEYESAKSRSNRAYGDIFITPDLCVKKSEMKHLQFN